MGKRAPRVRIRTQYIEADYEDSLVAKRRDSAMSAGNDRTVDPVMLHGVASVRLPTDVVQIGSRVVPHCDIGPGVENRGGCGGTRGNFKSSRARRRRGARFRSCRIRPGDWWFHRCCRRLDPGDEDWNRTLVYGDLRRRHETSHHMYGDLLMRLAGTRVWLAPGQEAVYRVRGVSLAYSAGLDPAHVLASLLAGLTASTPVIPCSTCRRMSS